MDNQSRTHFDKLRRAWLAWTGIATLVLASSLGVWGFAFAIWGVTGVQGLLALTLMTLFAYCAAHAYCDAVENRFPPTNKNLRTFGVFAAFIAAPALVLPPLIYKGLARVLTTGNPLPFIATGRRIRQIDHNPADNSYTVVLRNGTVRTISPVQGTDDFTLNFPASAEVHWNGHLGEVAGAL